MPIYGYTCTECGHALDALQKMSEDPLKDCPECEQPALKRQLSAPRFRLKGKGWYETDFKSDNQRNLAGDKSDSKSSDSKSTDSSKGKSSDKGGDSTSTATTKTESKPKKSESAA